jgi:peptidyl-dipeptidase Dcp
MKYENPLLADLMDAPYESIPFEKIKPEHFEPAIKKEISSAKKEIDDIIDNNKLPDFENTIEALEFSGMKLERLAGLLSNLNSAETSEDLQQVADKVMPLLTQFGNDITLNSSLFEKIKYVYEHEDRGKLTEEQKTLLEKTYKRFVRNGANLSVQDKEKLRKIDQELTGLKLTFSKNVLQETNDFQLVINDKKELSGLPEQVIEQAHELAKQQGKEGWIFTLHAPSYVPFMKYADNRGLRRKMSLAYGSRAFKGNEFDNKQQVLDIVRLRKERAQLLGFDTHADFVLAERMAKNPETVLKFLNDLYEVAYPAAKTEVQKLAVMAKKEGVDQIEKWDLSYYMEKLKKKELNLDMEKLRPYFQLEKVLEGIFEITGKLYDLQFEEIHDIDKYHPDIKTYKVTEKNGEYVALLYLDFFPRKGKRPGAWMTSYKSQWKKEGKDSRPHVSIVTNFSKPSKNLPSLLSFNEVTTLFHEFGHALHGMLANTTYPSLSGTNVYWDFVELPSQIMENWAYEKEALQIFAKHYKTGEIIPDEYIFKIKKSLQFMEGYATTRQLSFGFLDMDWHYNYNSDKAMDVGEFEKKSFAKTQLVPYHENNNMSVAFSHIFPGGYSAGYYSYKWAEVLDADAFSLFKEKGIFDRETAQKFKMLMKKGGTIHPMKLFKTFRGREPEVKALLMRAGLDSNLAK